jgi:hypothetical protein
MKNLVFFVLVFFSVTVAAQHDDTEISRHGQAREKIRAAHAAYITERLELTSAEAEKFWPVYREYAKKQKIIRNQAREARHKEAAEKELLALDLDIKQQELDLEKDYSLRLQEIISAEKVMKLKQAESDFRKLILRQIQRRRH